MQGAGVIVKMRVSRWRCLNGECERGHLRINCRILFVLTLGEPNESLNLFIFSAMARVVGRGNG